MKEDVARYTRWVFASHPLGKVEAVLVDYAQGLGRLDSQLIVEEKAFLDLSATGRATLEESIKFTDRLFISQLWVLGAYEVVRTLCQWCNEAPDVFGAEANQKIKVLKEKFERLRIPLAKLEAAKKHKQTDSPIAIPCIHNELGIAWQLSENIFISRIDLSDSFLNLLEYLRKLIAIKPDSNV